MHAGRCFHTPHPSRRVPWHLSRQHVRLRPEPLLAHAHLDPAAHRGRRQEFLVQGASSSRPIPCSRHRAPLSLTRSSSTLLSNTAETARRGCRGGGPPCALHRHVKFHLWQRKGRHGQYAGAGKERQRARHTWCAVQSQRERRWAVVTIIVEAGAVRNKRKNRQGRSCWLQHTQANQSLTRTPPLARSGSCRACCRPSPTNLRCRAQNSTTTRTRLARGAACSAVCSVGGRKTGGAGRQRRNGVAHADHVDRRRGARLHAGGVLLRLQRPRDGTADALHTDRLH